MNIMKDMEFIMELEKMKTTYRRTKIVGQDIYEDDAQHSWHVAAMAMFLEDYSSLNIDINKVIKMLLVHDLVEIYAGDTYGYDTEGYKDKLERENKAADRLCAMLSEKKAFEFRSLWEEFELEESDDALFALAMDRLQPIITNFNNDGGTWKEHQVSSKQIKKRIEKIKYSSVDLFEYANNLIEKAVEYGYIVE